MPKPELDTSAIRSALASEDFETVIAEVKSAMATDSVAAMADPVISDWMGRRFRNIFIAEASANPEALKHSERPFPLSLVDKRDAREKVAQRMFRKIDPGEIHTEMPRAEPGPFENTTLLFVPGLITGFMPTLAFQSIFPQMKERFGIRILASDSHPVRSSEANVADMSAAVELGIGTDSDPDGTLITADDDPVPPGDVFLMGYSKGAPDIATFLVERPDLAPRVRGFLSWAGANGGSYLANDMYDQIKDMPEVDLVKQAAARLGDVARRFVPFGDFQRIDRRIDEYDIKGALRSLTTRYRDDFNARNAEYLNSLGIPTFYVTGSTSVWEVAYYNARGVLDLDKYDKNNDMQLTQDEATPKLANANHLAMFHANHWDLSYDTFPWYRTMGSFQLREPFTRYSALSSSLLLMAELGVMD